MCRQAVGGWVLVGAVLIHAILLTVPARAQPPVPADKPTSPADRPTDRPAEPRPPAESRPSAEPVTPLESIPVIPNLILNQPPPTVPSGLQRPLPQALPGAPARALFQLQPSLSLIEEYTDNFDLSESNKQSNFRTTLSPGLRLLVNGVFLTGIIDYRFSPSHDSSTGDFELFHALAGQVAWQATPLWRLTLSDSFTRGDSPGDADRLGLRQERETFTTNTVSLASDYLIGTVATRQVYQNSTFSDSGGADTVSHRAAASATFPVYETHSMTVGYDYLRSKTKGGSDDDTNDGFERNDGDSKVKGHQLTVSGTRQLTSQAAVGLTGSYALRSFKDDNDDIDYQVWTAAFFSNYVLPGRLSLRGSAGLTGLTSDNGDNLGPGFFSFTSLAYQFGPALVTVTLDRGFSETFVDGQDFGVIKTEGVTGSLSYAFTPVLTGGVGGYYRRSKTTGIGNNAGSSSDDERSKTWGGSAGLTWRILRNLTVELSYSYQKHSTDAQDGDDNNDYTENRARLAINVSF